MLSGAKTPDGFTQGKTVTGSQLRTLLPRASVEFLQGALQNPEFGEEHLAGTLANAALPAGLIQRIGGQKQWISRYEVQRAIVLHANTPRVLKMNLVHFLKWRDLVSVVEARQSLPALKRAAEALLRSRIGEMAVGERIALARVASPGVIPTLRSDSHPGVVIALLSNGKLTEDEVVVIGSDERAPAAVLSAVGVSPRWKARHPVKMALLRNPRTPAAVSLGFLDSLPAGGLAEVLSCPQVPRLVKATARRILQARPDFIDREEGLT